MNDMYMSDAEIATGYRTAKNKTKQIGVLAELNAVSHKAMEEKLVELGLMEKTRGGEPLPASAPTTEHAPFDEIRARELYTEGRDDLAISEMLGVSKAVFAKWRKGQGLSANYPKQRAPGKPRRTPPPEEPAGDALTVRRMAEIFSQMAEWHPDAVVSVPAGALSHVRLVSEYGQAGEPLLRVEMT